MVRQKNEPLDCESVTLGELEEAVKQVLFSHKPEGQHSENREPTQEELHQRVRLERRT